MIELIVVIAILGILVAIAVPRLTGFQETAENRTDEANARILTSVAQTIYADTGSYPADLASFNVAGDYLDAALVLEGDGTWTYDATTGVVTFAE